MTLTNDEVLTKVRILYWLKKTVLSCSWYFNDIADLFNINFIQIEDMKDYIYINAIFDYISIKLHNSVDSFFLSFDDTQRLRLPRRESHTTAWSLFEYSTQSYPTFLFTTEIIVVMEVAECQKHMEMFWRVFRRGHPQDWSA